MIAMKSKDTNALFSTGGGAFYLYVVEDGNGSYCTSILSSTDC